MPPPWSGGSYDLGWFERGDGTDQDLPETVSTALAEPVSIRPACQTRDVRLAPLRQADLPLDGLFVLQANTQPFAAKRAYHRARTADTPSKSQPSINTVPPAGATGPSDVPVSATV